MERFVRRLIEDEEVWLDLEKGEFYGVNPAATAILKAWREGVREPALIAQALVQAFDVSPEEATLAVNAFLPKARAHGFLEA